LAQVKYLTVENFLEANIDDVIARIQFLSKNPEIDVPDGVIPSHSVQLDLLEFDSLLQGEAWDSRLRIQHRLGRFCFTKAMSSWVYCCFHRLLRLKEFSFDECLNAWIKGAFGNEDMTNSYQESSDHLVAAGLVFVKTPFIRERLSAIEQEESEKKTEAELELLRRSKFDCFIYLMEDLRNKTFKIGRSKTPGQRERTLQSEVPQIVIRLSIPAEESNERQLHNRFQNKRLRGEWFALTNEDLVWMVEFLKANGDSSRAMVDYQWFGGIHFACTPILPSK
jgi:Meiotically up-regulated gene 113